MAGDFGAAAFEVHSAAQSCVKGESRKEEEESNHSAKVFYTLRRYKKSREQKVGYAQARALQRGGPELKL